MWFGLCIQYYVDVVYGDQIIVVMGVVDVGQVCVIFKCKLIVFEDVEGIDVMLVKLVEFYVVFKWLGNFVVVFLWFV